MWFLFICMCADTCKHWQNKQQSSQLFLGKCCQSCVRVSRATPAPAVHSHVPITVKPAGAMSQVSPRQSPLPPYLKKEDLWVTQNLSLSLFMILSSQGRFSMKSLELKKKSGILSGVFNLSFIGSSSFTSWVHQSCVTLLWSYDLLWKPLEKAPCLWLGICVAESLHKNPVWMYCRLLIPKLSLQPSVGTSGSPAILVGSLLKPLLAPDSSCRGPGSWRVKKLGQEWGFQTGFRDVLTKWWNLFPSTWAWSEWEDTERGPRQQPTALVN